MGVRDAMADLVRATRKKTRRPLIAAHTVTVTPGNLPELPAIVRWTVRNADVFRLLGLQPLAQVGRTRERGAVSAVWDAVCEGVGKRIHNHTFTFGHPKCNEFAFVWLCGKDVFEVRRENSRLDNWFMRHWINGGLRGWTPAGEPRPVALARLAGRMLRDPRMLFVIPAFGLARVLGNPRLLKRPRAFAISVHHFMDADALDQERLDACVFKVPVDGRMVSMCEFNGGGLRAQGIAALADRGVHDAETAGRPG